LNDFCNAFVTLPGFPLPILTLSIEVIDGPAVGTFANILAVGASTITVDINLVTLGMVAGDSYRVLYGEAADKAHTHDTVDSPPISFNDIVDIPVTGLGLVTAYDEAGRTQSISGNGGNATHTLILPAGTHMVFGRLRLQAKCDTSEDSPSGSQALASADLQVNSVVMADAEAEAQSGDSADDTNHNNDNAGGCFCVRATNGHVVAINTSATVPTGTGNSDADAEFTVEAIAKI